MNLEMNCQIKGGHCIKYAETYVYRWGQRFEACRMCSEAVKEVETQEKSIPQTNHEPQIRFAI